MRRILFSSLLVFTLALVASGKAVAETPKLSVEVVMDKNIYLLDDPVTGDEPIKLAISMENTGATDILTSEDFSKGKFYLSLNFTSSDGERVKFNDTSEPKVPRVLPGSVQGEPVEILSGTGNAPAFFLLVELPDAHAIYDLNKAGRYTVKAEIQIRTYHGKVLTEDGEPVIVDGKNYADIKNVAFEGVIESNTIEIFLIADADGDGYYTPIPNPGDLITVADCDDTDAAINPGNPEILDNGIDDDCDPTSVDVVGIEPGIINVQVVRHVVGAGSHPEVNKVPISGMFIRAFDRSSACMNNFDWGLPSWRNYESIWRSSTCKAVADGLTDANGLVPFPTPDNPPGLRVPPGNYFVLAAYYPTNDPNNPGPIYIGTHINNVESGQTYDEYLMVIETSAGKKVPAKYTKRNGSLLLIVEPEFIEWDGTEALYPFVLDSIGDWEVSTALSPPEGFVSDFNSLTEYVDSEVEAVQFTVTDIGSDWVSTGVTYDLKHKDKKSGKIKKEKIKSNIGVKLSKKLAKQKGLGRFGKKK